MPDEIDFFNSFVDKGLKERLLALLIPLRITYTEAIKYLNNTRTNLNTAYWGRPSDRA